MAKTKFCVQRLEYADFEPEPASYRMLASGDHYIRLACPKQYWNTGRKK